MVKGQISMDLRNEAVFYSNSVCIVFVYKTFSFIHVTFSFFTVQTLFSLIHTGK